MYASFPTLVLLNYIFESLVFISARFAGLYCSGRGKFRGCFLAFVPICQLRVCGKVSRSSGIPPNFVS